MDRYRTGNYKQDSCEREQRDRPYYKHTMNNHPRKHDNKPNRKGEPAYSPQINQRYSPEQEYHNERGTSTRGGKSHSKVWGESRYGQAGSERTEHIVTPPPSYSGILEFSGLLSPEYNPENEFVSGFRDRIVQNTSTYKSFQPLVDGEGDIVMTDADSVEASILTELDLYLRDLEVARKSAQEAKISWRKNVVHRLKALEDILESKYKYSNSGSEVPLEIR